MAIGSGGLGGIPALMDSDGFKGDASLSPYNPDLDGKDVNKSVYPWGELAEDFRAFYPNTAIDQLRWNQLYPYKLLVIDARNNQVILGSKTDGIGTVSVSSDETGLVTRIHYVGLTDRWEYTFPITPQQLSTNTNFAIVTTATQQGVVEEHNGVVFKNIRIQGTTGIWPGRHDVIVTKKTNIPFISTIFENTIDAFDTLAASASQIKNAALSDTAQTKPETALPKDAELFSTGYYQALFLSRFLEQYALAKKDTANQHWRLCFFNQKDNEAYLCTPVSLNMGRSVQKPMEYAYAIELKAFRRIDLKPGPAATPGAGESSITAPNFYQRATNIITSTRSALSNSINLVKAVRSDFRRPFEILRQATLLVKDAAGVIRTAADLPSAIVSDAKDQIAQALSNITDAGQGLGSASSQIMLNEKYKSKISQLSETSAANGTDLGGPGSLIKTDSNPAFNMFRNPEANYDMLAAVSTSDFNLNTAQQLKVNNDAEKATSVTVDELKSQAAELQQLSRDIANQFGAGDGTLYEVLGLPAPKTRTTPLTIDELEILNSLYDTLSVFDQLTATNLIDNQRILNPIQYTKDQANANGIRFDNAQSKLSVPVPFKFNIEQISLRYLGDAKRWIEIATLNNLREPFIDEVGYEISLLSNGEGRRFTVPNDSRLYLGQKILLSSDVVSAFNRNIINIEKTGTVLLITVDGNADLESMKINQGAKIKGYIAGTVNSQDQIYIPVQSPAENDNTTPPPPIYRNDASVALSKVDFLLGDDGDVVLDPLGDIRLAAGLTNLIQILKTIILTTLGSDVSDPSLGVSGVVGRSVADVKASELFQQMESQIVADPRFSGIAELSIEISGPTVFVKLAVQAAGNGGIVPITFPITR